MQRLSPYVMCFCSLPLRSLHLIYVEIEVATLHSSIIQIEMDIKGRLWNTWHKENLIAFLCIFGPDSVCNQLGQHDVLEKFYMSQSLIT